MTALPRSLWMVLPPIGLLTFLLVSSVGPNGGDFMLAQRDVARVSLGEADLRSDVLQARVGFLINYDPLVDDIQKFSDFVDELSSQAMIQEKDQELLGRLKAKVATDEVALERFKTDNALLHNSLSYFVLLSGRLGQSTVDPVMLPALTSLTNAMLQLSRHPTPDARNLVETQLAQIADLAGSGASHLSAADFKLLLVHGHMLARLLPAVDDDLRTLFNVSTYELRQAIRRSQDERRSAEETRAQHYRIALYGMVIILLVVLVKIGLQWRAGLQLLRRRALIEALIADVSTQFVASQFEDGDAAMDHALARLGVAFGADRSFVILAGSPNSARTWCAAGVAAPQDWPQVLLEPALSAAKQAEDVIEIPSVKTASSGVLVDVLRQARVASWCGMILRFSNQEVALLGFDRLDGTSAWPVGDVGLLRMAAEVVQGALQRRLALAERLDLEGKLAQVRRMEAVGTFASGIAHNFNNVMGAIVGHAEMAADVSIDGSPVSHHVGQIRRAGERAQELVGKILEFGSRRKTPHAPIPVDRLLGETIAMLGVMLPDHVELLVDLQAPDQNIDGDAVQLQQVLMNVVRNAAQAIEERGKITIQVDIAHLCAPQRLSHDIIGAGDYIRFRIIDTGSGMSAVTLANIFQPFFTTRPAGTGLGLATTRDIVHDHGGVVDVRSAQQQGSAFTIWLPIVPAGPQRLPLPRSGSGETILLIAFNKSLVLKDEEIVAALGFEPVGFHSFEAAIEAVQADCNRFDAVMIDASHLDGGGRAMLATLRTLLPLVPIILVLAASADDRAADFLDVKVDRILRRPIQSATVAAALIECLQTRRDLQARTTGAPVSLVPMPTGGLGFPVQTSV